MNVVFEINEGPSTLISKIAFVGNHAFSEGRLSEVIDSREERWWRFLSSSDEYNPERLDYDKELLRRFYLKNGYADFEVVNASAELSPDRKSFFVTFTVHEGERYRVAKIDDQLAASQPAGRRAAPRPEAVSRRLVRRRRRRPQRRMRSRTTCARAAMPSST